MALGVLILTAKGYGKVVENPGEAFRQQSRGGRGVLGYKVTDDSGPVAVVLTVPVDKGERVLVLTAQGQGILTPVDDIARRSRSAGGVKVMTLADGDSIVGAAV